MKASPPRNVAATSNWLQIDTPEAGYASGVVTLVARISRTPSGRAVLGGIRASGRVVRIEKPDPPTDPPNAWTQLRDAGTPAGVDVVIAFDPADWPNPAQHGPGLQAPQPADIVLFGRLEDALAMVSDANSLREQLEKQSATGSAALQAYARERAPTPSRPGNPP
jgi:hypothetical protein